METPNILTLSTKKFNAKQTADAMCAKFSVTSIILGLSGLGKSILFGSGKSVLLRNIIMNMFKGCFEKIFVISLTIHIAKAWEPAKEYITDKLNMNPDR
jgi:hypothetical protein